MPKRKSEYTPEEWAVIREKAREADAKQRAKPARREAMKKYLSEYGKRPENRAKDRARHKGKRREQVLAGLRRRNYGVEPSEVAAMMAYQRGACGICRTPLDPTKPRSFGVDHDHETKEVRGLLCHFCNASEGMIKKTGLSVRQWSALAKDYLRWPPARVARRKEAAAWV